MNGDGDDDADGEKNFNPGTLRFLFLGVDALFDYRSGIRIYSAKLSSSNSLSIPRYVHSVL